MRPTLFMSEDNICAKNLLSLVSHGNAVIAELLRLKDHIPSIFCLDTKDEQQKYGEVIMDFSYFKISDAQEKKINNDVKLQDLDDDIKENYLELITRFYLAFESIYQYITDLNIFLEQLSDGIFIQQNLETVVQDVEGKQLLCESLYLYGAMLLICDFYIPGMVRERIMVAFYRYSTNQSQSNVDDVCKLLRDTGFSSHSKFQSNYPADYFSRVPVDPNLVEIVVGKLRSEDVYNQLTIFPLPEHRSTALASQAAMLFVSLFFSPIALSETTKMREIIDKYFPDNWVVSIYMGVTINIIDIWESFKAAKMALGNTINPKHVKEISLKHGSQVHKLIAQTKNMLKEGSLTDEKLLDSTNKVINVLRECNVAIRWLLLHTSKPIYNEMNKKSKQIREIIIKESKVTSEELLDLLINTSQLELKVRETLSSLLETKNDNWVKNLKTASEKLIELSGLFAENKPFVNIPKNDKLKIWLEQSAKQIIEFSSELSRSSNKKVIQMVLALEEVQEFHGLQNTPTVLQGLSESRECLRNGLRISGLQEKSLVVLETVADVSYAWCIIDSFTALMQDSIRENPSITGRLRAVFLKLANAMEIPLLRINQSHSEDLVSVSQYYSNELVNYIHKVLQIIPEMVFNILEKIINLQTWNIKEVPTKLEKDRLREFAQLDQRMQVAKLTHSASVFTKGVLMMRTTLVGVVRIDPAELLEEGLRRELARHVNKKFEELLDSQVKGKSYTSNSSGDLLSRLQTLADSMCGYKRSLEYIQDYVNIHGLKMWQEEISDIIDNNVAKEVKLRKGVAVHSPSAGFMGSLARELLRLTDCRNALYISINTAWYDYKTQKETIDIKTFAKLSDAIGANGLHGLDKLYGFMIVSQLQDLVELIKINIERDKNWNEIMTQLDKDEPVTNVSSQIKLLQQSIAKGAKLWMQLSDIILTIGTLQTLRKHIAYQLNTTCKFDSSNLESCLRTMNDALLDDVKQFTKDHSKPKPSTELLHNLDKYLVRAGIYDPYQNIYVKTFNQHINFYPVVVMLLVTISQLNRMQIFCNTGDILPKRFGDNLDGHPLVVGIYTFLKQFHQSTINKYIDLLSQYIIYNVNVGLNAKYPEFPTDALVAIKLLEYFCSTFKIPYSKIEDSIPINLLTYQAAEKPS